MTKAEKNRKWKAAVDCRHHIEDAIYSLGAAGRNAGAGQPTRGELDAAILTATHLLQVTLDRESQLRPSESIEGLEPAEVNRILREHAAKSGAER